MSDFIKVEDRLPDFEQLVIVRWPSGYDGSHVYAWGARIDVGEGWAWGIARGSIAPNQSVDMNDIEADDDYPVTHWQPLPEPPNE